MMHETQLTDGHWIPYTCSPDLMRRRMIPHLRLDILDQKGSQFSLASTCAV